MLLEPISINLLIGFIEHLINVLVQQSAKCGEDGKVISYEHGDGYVEGWNGSRTPQRREIGYS